MVTLHIKWGFQLMIPSSVNVTKFCLPAVDLVRFTEEILNGKLDFSCSESNRNTRLMC